MRVPIWGNGGLGVRLSTEDLWGGMKAWCIFKEEWCVFGWKTVSKDRRSIWREKRRKLQSAGKALAVLEALKSSPKSAKAPTCLADKKELMRLLGWLTWQSPSGWAGGEVKVLGWVGQGCGAGGSDGGGRTRNPGWAGGWGKAAKGVRETSPWGARGVGRAKRRRNGTRRSLQQPPTWGKTGAHASGIFLGIWSSRESFQKSDRKVYFSLGRIKLCDGNLSWMPTAFRGQTSLLIR